MPGLVRGMARTAAVVGTATATRNAVDRRQADKNAQAYAHAGELCQCPNDPAAATVCAAATTVRAATGRTRGGSARRSNYALERLGALKAQGPVDG